MHNRPDRALPTTRPALPPDPVGDALADCFSFLLARMAAKAARPGLTAQTPTPEREAGEDAAHD